MTKERHIFRSGRRRLRLLILPAVLLAAAGGGVWFWFEHSPARAVERMLLSIKGLEAEQVEEQSPDRILIRRISYRADDGVAAGCEGLEIGLDANGVPRSVSAAGVEIGRITQLLPLVAGAARRGTLPAEFSVTGSFRRKARKGDFAFEFKWMRRPDGDFDIEFSMPDPGLAASGSYRPQTGAAELRLRGRATTELLELVESRIPAEVALSGAFDVDGVLKLDFGRPDPVRSFEGELAFSEGTAVSGGVWEISPGRRAVFRWYGADRPWEVALPETSLRRPLELPLGALTVTGGADSVIRFSVVNAPPVGEMTGVMRIDGHYDRGDGSWMFRQSESSDRAVRWSGELPCGEFNCIWRSPRISGGGSRSHGSIDFSFGFESVKFRAPGSQQELAALPGTLTGSWNFDYDNPEASSFELSGLLKSSKLEWPNPESAWSASSALVSFRFSRQTGEREAMLVLEPELGGVNLYGGGVPKLKLEGFSGRFNSTFDPAAAERMPLRVEGAVEVRRVNPVRSMFGAGEFRDLRFSGYAELSPAWLVQGFRAAGDAENALFRYSECEISAAMPVFELRFDRNAITPGDNFLGRMDTGRLTLSALGGTFSVPKAHAAWSSELREAELLPERWTALLELPAGTVGSHDLEGSFQALSSRVSFDHSQVGALEAKLTGFEARLGEQPAVRQLRAGEQVLVFNRDKEGGSGRFSFSDGSFSESGFGAEQVSAAIPLVWRDGAVTGNGSFRAGSVTVPGGLLKSASGDVRFEGGTFRLAGQAASPFWPEGALLWTGEFSWGKQWRAAGDFSLKPTTLSAPLPLGGILPAAAGLSLKGGLAGKGTFEFLPARTEWSCEFTPADASLSGNGLALARLSGTLRLPGGGARSRNSGGEFRFGEAKLDDVAIRNGSLSFRLLRPEECDILSAGGTVWGGRARLAAPFTLRAGTEAADAGIVVRGLEWAGLLRSLGLPGDLIDGRADGTLFWRIHADGRPPALASAELTAAAGGKLKLEALEPFVQAGSSGSAARQRILLNLLRDFNSRSLRLRLEEASGGGWLLSLSAAGRPGQLQIRDENYRRLIRSVDPAAFGLDGEIEFTVNYRVPGKKEAKEKK